MRKEDFGARKSPEKELKKRPSGFLIIVIIAVVIILFIYGGKQLTSGKIIEVSYLEFLGELEEGNIEEVWLDDNQVVGSLVSDYTRGGKKYNKMKSTFPPSYFEGPEGFKDITARIKNKAKFHYNPPSAFMQIMMTSLPWIIIAVIVWYIIIRQMRAYGGAGNILNFGKSTARFATSDKRKITFEDVAGIDEAKEEVKEMIEYLKEPKKFQKLGGRIPRGILLVGSPGTGKTLLAKAIAGEANVPFLSICGSDFVEMFVGVGASRVRDLFTQAKRNSPCIVFLDEIDAVGRRRGSGLGGGHDEREQTLNAILVEMDGFDRDEGIIVIAATNRPDILDPALLRPGRFDREIVIDLPDIKGREEILKVHARKVKLGKDCDLKVIAKTTPTFSGADLEAIINEAAIRAATRKKEYIDQEDLEEARDKIRWGRQKRAKVMDEEDKRITAFHESGHALISELIPEIEPLHRVTIIPRGIALGATMTLPEKDRYHMQKRYAQGIIVMFFGGRVAEELACKDISAGAKDDIKKATELARMMVCEWGMSETLGPINYSESEEHLFLGREITRSRNHSEFTAQEIDKEVRRILDEGYNKAKDLILQNIDKLEKLAKALLKYETLTGAQVKKIIKGEDIERPNETPVSHPEIGKPVEEKQVSPKPLRGEEPITGPAQA